MRRSKCGFAISFAAGLLVASCLPYEFTVVVAAITIIILCIIFRRRMC
ncbi:MAG: hypothetical protein Q4D44_08105 [Eubacteriales bacterium]|nr:hypothetical protein [Eubacteriales bacterium]